MRIIQHSNNCSIFEIAHVAALIPRLVTVSVKTQETMATLPYIDVYLHGFWDREDLEN